MLSPIRTQVGAVTPFGIPEHVRIAERDGGSGLKR